MLFRFNNIPVGSFFFSVAHNVLMLSFYARVNTANCPLSCLAQGYLSPSVASINYD